MKSFHFDKFMNPSRAKFIDMGFHGSMQETEKTKRTKTRIPVWL